MSPSARSPHSPDQSPRAVVCIGGSAGGLEALLTLLGALPADLGLALVYVSHLPAETPSQAPEVLSRATSLRVVPIVSSEPLKPDHLYVVSPGCMLTLEAGTLKVQPVQHHQHQIDRCFEALTAQFGARCIGVLLSGMNEDGVIGLGAIKLAGGVTFAQDGSAQAPRMPRAAVDAGCVDEVLSPTEMARELAQLVRHPWLDPVVSNEDISEQLAPVLAVLHEQYGMDFGEYRSNPLHRRVMRRMAIGKHVHLKQYAAALREDEREAHSLIQDILIGVTEFFRDPAAFEALAEKALPQIFYGRSANEPRKVWILGCSTGEEAYSIAMLIEEFTRERDYQIFATDLNPTALTKARNAVYPKSIASTIAAPRLRRFFDEVPQGYRVTKALRHRCNFSAHNALSYPPFANVDLLCCRNVMIYMSTSSQQKLIATFHRSLRPQGILFLGASESLIERNLFTTVDARYRIFAKRPNALPQWVDATSSFERIESAAAHALREPLASPEEQMLRILRESDRSQVKEYGPPSVVIDAQFEILHYHGNTNPYLANYSGRPNSNLLKMCREGMLVHLRTCLMQAKRSSSSVVTPRMKVYAEDLCHEIVVRVIPVNVPDIPQRYYCVVFEPAATTPVPARGRGGKRKNQQQLIEAQRERITQQSAEISLLREQMQQTQERQEAVQEELRAANEEVLSTNEELMAKNGELFTVQQDLQSANEEQSILIGELRIRSIAQDQLNDELSTLVAHVLLPIIMVWADLRIRRLTPTAMRLLGASLTDLNRPISDFRSPIQQFDLSQLLANVISEGRSHEVQAVDVEDRWRQVCIHPYRRADGHVDGAVVVLTDIHVAKGTA